jgi:hypothetical protein
MLKLLALVLATATPAQRAECVAPEGYASLNVAGRVQASSTFRSAFGDDFFFVLAPNEYGWVVRVEQRDRDEDLARLTPPWHFVPNPRYIEGWHFRNASNTASNDGSVNAPQERRAFIFSPEVGHSLDYGGSATTAVVVEEVRSFGRGELTLTDFRLTPFVEGERASFEVISFEVCLIWRTADARLRSLRNRLPAEPEERE